MSPSGHFIPTPIPPDWQIWQIVDSAFPTGGFAHSGGLESAWQHGTIRSAEDLTAFVRAAVEQAFYGAAAFVAAAARSPDDFEQLDRACDALLSNHVANRASRVQGSALLATAAHTFRLESSIEIRARVRKLGLPGHLASCFGAVCGAIGLDERRAVSIYLFNCLRGLMSAAVRLGIVGPMDAQRMQHVLAMQLEPLARRPTPAVEDAAQTSPFLELIHGTHDRLYSRLFVS